jgi:sugar lactone lactonase YvrE
LRNPQGMTVLGTSLLVCDQGRPAVVRIDLTNGRATVWGDQASRPHCPVDIKADAQERVYVADPTRRAVLVYTAGGRWIEELAAGPPESFRPAALLADGAILYVGNVASGRVERWDIAERTWLDALVPPGAPELSCAPAGLALDTRGRLLVSDALQGRIHRWSLDKGWVDPLGSPGRQTGQLVRPKQLCCTAAGRVWVADAGRQSVMVFDDRGGFLWEIHELAQWEGLTLPAGLLAVPAAILPAAPWAVSASAELAGDCVLVSDSLGRVSLTLLSVREH